MRIRRAVARYVPASLKRPLQACALFPLDALDFLLARRKEMVPPRYLNYAGGGDFEGIGNEFFLYFKDLAGLKPDHRVFEVGCGVGRMARPLTKYLITGTYDGMDVVSAGIRWSQRHITSHYPNFRFQIADVYNPTYNSQGHFSPSDYSFPFEGEKFDFIFLTSVFTHMFKREIENYLREICRTLRPNGKCLITFFLLNDVASKLISEGRSSFEFKFVHEDSYVNDERNPAIAVAFEEKYIRALYSKVGLNLETLRYGSWCGRDEYLSFQDILIGKKS